MRDFDEFFGRATEGKPPYAYQRQIALSGLPDLLSVPTGTGKTAAVILGWLYRRLAHPAPEVRASTPHWLVYVLPMRVLVEQVVDFAEEWLFRLGLASEIPVYRIQGGAGRLKSEWRRQPEKEAIFVGTLDMITSRQLNRGYGAGRHAWPIEFALFNNGCHFVYDEIQLMGPALPTSRQLHGLRAKLGVAMPSTATWMSATVDPSAMDTIDAPPLQRLVGLTEQDRAGHLATRLAATRRVEALAEGADAASTLLERHQPRSLSLAILNTVDRARAVWKEIAKRRPEAEIVLLHSRFRPGDRERVVQRALAPVDPSGPGRIVVSTQVVEAGVDISARLLLTEAAPWPSIVQRAGRCNRDGLSPDATLLWLRPQKALPYEDDDLKAASTALGDLEGRSVTSEQLTSMSASVPSTRQIHPALRRADLLGLFDTLPDMTGNDIDVSRFIRPADDLDVEVAWRDLNDDPHPEIDTPAADERCPVPVVEVRKFVGKDKRAWYFDHLRESWVRCAGRDIRPGMVIVLPAQGGGYHPERGWDPQWKQPVELVADRATDPIDALEGIGSDHLTYGRGRWVTLVEHLSDVEREVRVMAADLSPDDLTPHQLGAAAVAGRLHDIGKAHPSFQEMLLATEPAARHELELRGPWAKSARGKGPRNKRRYFRHELVSALALLDEGASLLEGVAEPDLVRYLVAAHHGRVRLGFRPMPDEGADSDDSRVALGVHDGELVGPIAVPGGEVPASTMRLSVMELGSSNGPSWGQRMLTLRDRADLGPFRLAFLEALVRLADWRVSASYEVEGD